MKSKVELRRIDGSDLDVVNAARVSFDKESQWEIAGYEDDVDEESRTIWVKPVEVLSQKDKDLIHFLARGMTKKEYEEIVEAVWWQGVKPQSSAEAKESIERLLTKYRNTPVHWAPFAHVGASFRITAPIFVARQMFKHKVGLQWWDEDDGSALVENEVSRRYVDDEPQFYDFEVRERAENVKQGSGGAHPHAKAWGDYFTTEASRDAKNYRFMSDGGVCPEQARAILPQSTMTTWIWTGTLAAWMRVIKLRMDPHAQQETREVVEEIAKHVEAAFPVSYEALMRY